MDTCVDLRRSDFIQSRKKSLKYQLIKSHYKKAQKSNLLQPPKGLLDTVLLDEFLLKSCQVNQVQYCLKNVEIFLLGNKTKIVIKKMIVCSV